METDYDDFALIDTLKLPMEVQAYITSLLTKLGKMTGRDIALQTELGQLVWGHNQSSCQSGPITSTNQARPDSVVEWTNFADLVTEKLNQQLPELNSVFSPSRFHREKLSTKTTNADVRYAFIAVCDDCLVNKLFENQIIRGAGRRAGILNSTTSFNFESELNDRKQHLVGEVKSPSYLNDRIKDIVGLYNNTTKAEKKGDTTAVRKCIEQIYSYMCLKKSNYGILTTYTNTWFLEAQDVDQTDPDKPFPTRLLISKAIRIDQLLPSLFFIVHEWLNNEKPEFVNGFKQIQQEMREHSNDMPNLRIRSQKRKGTNYVISNDKHAKSSKKQNTEQGSSGEQSQTDQATASSANARPALLQRLDNAYVNEQLAVEVIGEGMTGKIFKATITDGKEPACVVLKCYDVFELDSRARKHIKKELKIYKHLSSRQSSSKHFAQMLAHGSFMITSKGLCLSYVSGEVIMFSEMTAQQKSACELALEELHSCGVKHGDVHYGIFLLNENFASIIDFGLSSICSDEDLLEREKDLLEWKLDNDDNSGKQEITKNY